MDWLRWILLLIGAAIIAAIWWSGHRRARERDETLFERARRDPGEDSAAPPADATAAEPGIAAEVFDTLPDIELPPAGPTVDTGPVPALDPAGDERPLQAPEDRPAAATGAARERPAEKTAPTTLPRSHAAAGESPAKTEAERIESVFVVAPGGERLVGSRLQALFSRHGLQHGEMGIFHLHDAEGRVLFSVANLVEPGTFDPATMDTLSTPGVALFLRLPGPPSAEIALDRMLRTARAMAEELDARVLDQQQSTLTRQTEQHLRDQMRAWDHRHRRGPA